MKKSTFLVIALDLLLALHLTSVHAMLIDDYSANQGPLTIYTSDTVTDSGILGGQRRVYFWGGGPPELEVSDGVLAFTNVGPTNAVSAYVYYEGPDGNGLGPVDLTEGGASDRFLVDVSAVTLGTVLGDTRDTAAAFKVFISDGFGNGLISENFVFIDTPRVYEVFFSDMITMGSGGNLEAADQVVIYIDTLYYYSSITIDNFSVGGTGVPDADADGVPDGSDLCPGTVAGPVDVDVAGCSDAQVDIDGDGYCNVGAPSPGPSACSGTDNCPTISNPDQLDINGDGFGDACVSPGADVSDQAELGAGTTVGINSQINKGVVTGENNDIGEDVVLAKDVETGDNVVVGDGALINKGVTIGEGTVIGANVTIGKNCAIGAGVTIGDNSVIGKDCNIGDNASIGANVTMGRNVTVLPSTVITDGETIGNNATVGP